MPCREATMRLRKATKEGRGYGAARVVSRHAVAGCGTDRPAGARRTRVPADGDAARTTARLVRRDIRPCRSPSAADRRPPCELARRVARPYRVSRRVDFARPLREVRTAVEIDAPAESVWSNVIGIAELPPPAEWVFRLGIAYPVRARIHGAGVGAVRTCEFSTGPFVEPITAWDPPRRLAFDVRSAAAADGRMESVPTRRRAAPRRRAAK